ncbi:D-mandelate dehydrogenase-like dehydrogenase [Aspergillus affinis]|uniref:D-mandelate dehydrogenase-like dehydrogenase n=1 Tax=Aspergillus affinis TaxID=1070780 RepID=UPI0022FECB80|nr:putative D-mandelate dehydrogenase [Aspergillus affinis]KAI9037794.1 putative D-mandelate dehydrogenase [Aspergillus affinis]
MPKQKVLHLGAPIKYNPDVYARFSSTFEIIQPNPSELPREEFKRALQERRWGDFHAVFRPFWNTGGEMGNWDQELIDLLPGSVKVMASAGAGYDWVDVKGLAKRGITYCNGASASSDSVSDMALILILSTFRNLRWSHSAAHSLSPTAFADAHKNSPLQSYNPRARTLGIIGLGAIGYAIAKKAHAAFNMSILYHDIIRKTPSIESSIGARFFDNLDAMLGASDCVIVATPFAGETLMTRERFSAFKKGGRFVNIARGSLVDEDALVEVLEEGQLSAAGLDVHANEPYVHPRLAGNQRVFMVSHNAGGTVDTHVGFERLAMENIEAFFKTGKALTPVNAHLVEQAKTQQVKSVL